MPISIRGAERATGLIAAVWPTGMTKPRIGAPFKFVQDDDTPMRRGLALSTDEIKLRIATLIPKANRGKYAETAGGPFRFTRNLQIGGREPSWERFHSKGNGAGPVAFHHLFDPSGCSFRWHRALVS